MKTKNYLIIGIIGWFIGIILNPYLGILILLLPVYHLYKLNKNTSIDLPLEEKQEQIQTLTEEINTKTQTLHEKQEKLDKIEEILSKMEKEKEKEINTKLADQITQLKNIKHKIKQQEKELIILQEDIDLQDYGLYKPQYTFQTAERYKEELKNVRTQQKEMIKAKTAAICNTEWTVDGSKQKGKAMTNANIKQIINNFNIESERIITKVTYSNRNQAEEKIRKIYDKLNKLGERNAIYLTTQYRDLKIQEMHLAVDYMIKKQEEQEALKEIRAREREEKKIEQERQKAEKEARKEKEKLEQEKAQVQALLEKDKENQELLEKIKELQQQIAKKDDDIQQIENRRERKGAGFVYIISNKGSFGEDVYKIGVTRRDDPQLRVNELSNASVPFKYDTNAFIFSRDAFALETELHQRFSKERVNKVNNHKEFFKLNKEQIQQIADEHKNQLYHYTLEPFNEEYVETMKIDGITIDNE